LLPSALPEVAKSTAGPPGAADAVLASDSDKPAAPNTGKALLRRFRFEVCTVLDMGGLQKKNAVKRLLLGTSLFSFVRKFAAGAVAAFN
jgi:hypothetical protein